MIVLYFVCMNGDLDICYVLLSYGVDIIVKIVDYSILLYIVMFSCNIYIVELLIREG